MQVRIQISQPIGVGGAEQVGAALGSLDMHEAGIEQHADRRLNSMALDVGVLLDLVVAEMRHVGLIRSAAQKGGRASRREAPPLSEA